MIQALSRQESSQPTLVGGTCRGKQLTGRQVKQIKDRHKQDSRAANQTKIGQDRTGQNRIGMEQRRNRAAKAKDLLLQARGKQAKGTKDKSVRHKARHTANRILKTLHPIR